MLFKFLKENKTEILAVATRASLVMAGARPSSAQLEAGLPIFFDQLIDILKLKEVHPSPITPNFDRNTIKLAASTSNEVEIANASGYPNEVKLAKSSGHLGQEFLRLGYTLSHVVHVYGSLCQSITGLATKSEYGITPREFRDLNRCLDVAIASAVTEYQSLCDLQKNEKEIQRCGFCAHELRNALGAATISFQLIKSGTVAVSGSVGQILEKNLLSLENLIGRSLTEVKLRQSEVTINAERISLLLLVDQILLTANIEAKTKDQYFTLQIAPTLIVEADRQFLNSALSNLIQNAIKYSQKGTKIEIRGIIIGENILIEVEDECGGLAANAEIDLFKPFEQQNKNRQGLGLGLNIARKAIELHGGTLEVRNLPNKGCVFSITLPKNRN
jgi:signal transduction histidine kinase